jgi:DNA polymerase-3 subunit epsilon
MFDVETTGLSPFRGDRVIEIAAVAVEKHSIVDEFDSLVNAGKRIHIAAQLVHGITDEMLTGAPKPEAIFPMLRDFIHSSILVAHNALFDVGFLSHEFERLGLALDNDYHCTLEMSRLRYPRLRNHRLETVYRHVCGKPGKEIKVHRALGDARMVAAIWMEMMGK